MAICYDSTTVVELINIKLCETRECNKVAYQKFLRIVLVNLLYC